DLFDRAAFPMAHHKRGSFRGAQLPQCLFHLLSQLGVARKTVRSRPFVRHQVQGILFLLVRLSAWRFASRVLGAFLPHAVDRVVCRNAISPSTEVRARSKLPQVPVGSQKGLL